MTVTDRAEIRLPAWAGRVLTLDEWDALGQTPDGLRLELVEGVVQVVPAPTIRHQYFISRLTSLLHVTLPDELMAVPGIDALISADVTPTVRCPDLVVIPTPETNIKRAALGDVLLAVEVLSPGSRRVDRITKAREYAEARIAAYWLIDLDAMTITVHTDPSDAGYRGIGTVTSPREIPLPGGVDTMIDLAALLRRR